MNELDNMPMKKIKFLCTHKGADKLTGEKLSKMLVNIGLNCEQASPEKCDTYIKEVSDKLPKGKFQSFHYSFGKNTANENIDPEWKPIPSMFNYQQQLETVIAEKNFKKLYKDFCDFPGREFPETTIEKETNIADSIKDFFSETLISVSNFMIEGIEMESLKAICINLLPKSEDPKDYIVNNCIIIYLAKNYDEEKQTVDAVDAICLEYSLNIENYNDKSGSKHKSILKYSGRSVTYCDAYLLEKHASYCK